MRSANFSLVAGHDRSLRSTSKAAVRLSEDRLIKVAAVLVGMTFLFTVAVLGFCDRQDEELAAHGVNIEQLAGEVRNER